MTPEGDLEVVKIDKKDSNAMNRDEKNRNNNEIPDMRQKRRIRLLLKKIISNLRYLFYYLLCFLLRDKYLFIKAWVDVEHGVCLHRNWGDELNEHLLGYLTSKRLIILPCCRIERMLHIKSYLFIGSILTAYDLTHTIVWGSGILNNNDVDKIHGIPDRICAVRGPRTRKELLKLGLSCPEVYGDPALLMPRFYQPVIKHHYSLGIIPHLSDLSKADVQKLLSDPRVRLIKVRDYEKWTDFIDEICSCDFIISSSLHGLIIAEAYGVPSQWIEFGTYIDGWEFKYYDFYESIGKVNESPLVVNETTTYEMLMEKKNEWRKGSIDLDKLMDACPLPFNSTNTSNSSNA